MTQITIAEKFQIGVHCFQCGALIEQEIKPAAYCLACREKWNRMDEVSSDGS